MTLRGKVHVVLINQIEMFGGDSRYEVADLLCFPCTCFTWILFKQLSNMITVCTPLMGNGPVYSYVQRTKHNAVNLLSWQ